MIEESIARVAITPIFRKKKESTTHEDHYYVDKERMYQEIEKQRLIADPPIDALRQKNLDAFRAKNKQEPTKKEFAKFVEPSREEKAQMSPRIPEYVGECFMKISDKLSHHPWYIGYSYRDEMIDDAIENCIMGYYNFNHIKYKNPFAYFTQIAWWAFSRRKNKERNLTKIKLKNAMQMVLFGDSPEFDAILANIPKELPEVAYAHKPKEKLTAKRGRGKKRNKVSV